MGTSPPQSLHVEMPQDSVQCLLLELQNVFHLYDLI